MPKKLLSLILAVIMCAAVLTGCTLFEPNNEKNYKQVVAEIAPITQTIGTGENQKSHTSDKIQILKYELVNAYNSEGRSMVEQGATVEQALDQVLKNMITIELVLIDIEKKIEFGEIEWFNGETVYKDIQPDGSVEDTLDYTDKNAVRKLIFNAIDSSLKSIKNEIYSERNLDIPAVTDAPNSTETTYPVREVETEEDNDTVVREPELFVPAKTRWPGYYGDALDKSLGRESMRRFLAMIRDRVKDNMGVTEEDKKAFKDDDDLINERINTQGIEYVYPMLADTHYMKFLIGKSAEKQVKYDKLQKHITDKVEVTDNEVKDTFNAKVAQQILTFGADESAFGTAIKNGENVYYYPNNRHFFVKHILLPFNTAQTAKLKAYKDSGTKTLAQIQAYRTQLVDEIVVYPHVNGEDDINNPTNVRTVFSQIKAAMASASASPKIAERKFDDFIYMYNTDPGIFNQPKGYSEVYALKEGESESYMPEFADMARDLYFSYEVGQVHNNYAITDYGVHIMYLASRTYAGHTVKINDYQTPGEYKTYFDIIKEEIQTLKEDEEFLKWQNKTITYYENDRDIVTIYEKRFADLKEV